MRVYPLQQMADDVRIEHGLTLDNGLDTGLKMEDVPYEWECDELYEEACIPRFVEPELRGDQSMWRAR